MRRSWLCFLIALAPPSAIAWQATASMSQAREDHSAVLLGNGQVLVVGGIISFSGSTANYTASAERFDPSTNQWRSAGSMATPRAAPIVALLGSGKVLVAGGRTTGEVELASAELFDPATNSWDPAGSLNTARGAAAASLVLPSGDVFVIGGGNLAAPELYSPISDTWRAAAAPVSGVVYSAVLLASGKVLIRGSAANYVNPLSTELYDPATDSWQTAANTEPNTDYDYVLQTLASGQVLLMEDRCCTTLDLYDPAQDKWTARSPSPYASRMSFTASALPSGQLLMAGGNDTYTSNLIYDVVLYDAVADVWFPTAPLTHARVGHSATVLESGDVLVAGGYDDASVLATAERFDPIFADSFE